MLRLLSGRTHRVATGVALAVRGRIESAVETAAVTFRPLEAAEIAEYAGGGEGLDKAGAYAIQGRAGAWVVGLKGEVDTVVGLPIGRVRALLRREGLGGR
jgi:septum formation protein